MNLLTSSTSPRGRATLRRTVCDFLCFFIAHIVTHHAVAFLIDPHSVQAIITRIKQTGRGTEFICEKIFSQMNLQSVSDAGNDAEAPPELLLFAMPGPRGLAQKRARNGRVFGARSEEHTPELQPRDHLVCR